MGLIARGVGVEIIGSDEVDSPEFHTTKRLRFLNLRGSQKPAAGRAERVRTLLLYYVRLIRYVATAKPRLLHILWNNRLEYFDRTLLMAYYRLMGKRIAITAHNVNQARRDSNDSPFNRLTLRIQYRMANHIFVHTEKMKAELLEEFGVSARSVTVIRHPINNAFPDTNITPAAAKQRIGIRDDEKTVLFFGRIRPYKGLEDLLTALRQLVARQMSCKLIIAGEPKKGSEEYLKLINGIITREFEPGRIIS